MVFILREVEEISRLVIGLYTHKIFPKKLFTKYTVFDWLFVFLFGSKCFAKKSNEI